MNYELWTGALWCDELIKMAAAARGAGNPA